MLNVCRSCIFFILSVYVLVAKGQTTSNEGLDFWAVFPTHIPTSPTTLAKMSLYITSQQNSSGKVSIGDQNSDFNVLANQIVEIPIDYDLAHLDYSLSNTVIKNKGIHIKVDPGKAKVAVFAFISASARSEAYLVLPQEAMGQQYFAIGHQGIPVPTDAENGYQGKHYLIITATEPNTNIVITRTDRSVITKNLPEAGDIFQLTSDEDFSGTRIESTGCSKFAVYTGHSGIAYNHKPGPINSFDPLIQQLYPINSWGRKYGLIPFYDRTYFYKVVAAEDGTEINVDGKVLATLNAGESFIPEHLPLNAPLLLIATKPVSVAQFAYVQVDLNMRPEVETLGDPDMVILNPEEYNLKTITLFASFDRTPEFYLNVFMKTAGTGSFRINGLVPSGIWKKLPADPSYSYIQIAFNQNTLKSPSLALTADEGFNAMAYGFGEFESYAYSAGTNLAVNNYLQLTNLNANVTSTNACINEPLAVKVVLPAKAIKLEWQFEDPSSNFSENNPVATSFVNEEGGTQYTYTYNKGIVRYNTLGIHKVVVIAELDPATNPCPDESGGRVYTYNFEIIEPQFSVPDTVEVLAGGTVKIPGKPGIGNIRYQWSPSFGLSDPTIVDPIVTAEQTSQYKITSYSDLGCSITKEVVVKVTNTLNIPNTISPNGDGVNDVWNLVLLNTYENALVEIFNRYGQRVYSSVGYRVPFDGYYQGQALPLGTYYYVISPRNGKKSVSGSLTIIR